MGTSELDRVAGAMSSAEAELGRLRAAMDASPDMIYITDRESMRFLYVNETACRLTGHPREQILRMGPADLLRQDAAEVERDFDEAIAAGAEGTVRERKSVTREGLRTMVEVRRRALRIDGRWVVFTIAHDISLRKRAEQALIRSGRMFAALSATNEAIMRSACPEELYRRVCEAAVGGGKLHSAAVLIADGGLAAAVATSVGMPRELCAPPIPIHGEAAEARGLVATALRERRTAVSNDLARDERERHRHATLRAAGVAAAAAVPLVSGGEALGAVLFYSAEKHTFDAEIVKLLERVAQNVVFALDNFATERQRRMAEERIQYLATHDGLTGLPNRMLFSELLTRAIDAARRYKRPFALLFIDLDRFKSVNDSLGHQAGDELLQTVAGRLKRALRASDVVARLSGDEFAVLLHEIASAAPAQAAARKLVAALGAPMRIAGTDCSVTASIGIALCPADATEEGALMRSADQAMYEAKQSGRNAFSLFGGR